MPPARQTGPITVVGVGEPQTEAVMALSRVYRLDRVSLYPRTLIKLPCCLSRFRRAGWASRFVDVPDRLMAVCIGSAGMKLLSAMTSGVNITCVHYVCLFALGLCQYIQTPRRVVHVR